MNSNNQKASQSNQFWYFHKDEIEDIRQIVNFIILSDSIEFTLSRILIQKFYNNDTELKLKQGLQKTLSTNLKRKKTTNIFLNRNH